MKKYRSVTAGLCLTLVSANLLMPWTAFTANTNNLGGNARAAAAPIGTVESDNPILINGRASNGKDVVWDGELLQAPPGVSAQIKLAAFGQVKLAGGTLVRVSTAVSENGGDKEQARRLLVASLFDGQVNVEMATPTGAYFEAGGRTWLAGGTSRFELRVNRGAAEMKPLGGTVSELGGWSLNLPALAAKGVAPAAKLDPRAAAEQRQLLRSINLVTNRTGVDASQPVRLAADAKAGMIGMLEATGARINGREVRGHELLWDGELVQAPANAPAQITLAGIGQVTLAKGTVAKLTAATTKLNGTDRRVLAASVMSGEINVRLAPEAGAFVEANGHAFAAGAGARFRLTLRENGTVVEPSAGEVREIGSWMLELNSDLMNRTAKLNDRPRQYLIRPVAAAAEKPAGYLLNVKRQSTQTLRFLVTDDRGKPAPAVPVLFTLNAADGKPVGTLGTGANAGKAFETRTDTTGVAVVQFNAGANAGSTSISASVRGDNAANNSVVVVDSDDNDFWTKRHAIPVFAVAAAAIVTGIVIYANREERLPIKGTGPTQIVP